MSALLADIGGTNTRCAVTHGGSQLKDVRVFNNQDFDGPDALLKFYLGELPEEGRPTHGAIAVAAPVLDEQVQMINIDWRLSSSDLEEKLGLESIDLMNDFEAVARALPELGNEDLRQIGGGSAAADKPKAVLGPGTGLGVASLVPVHSSGQLVWQPVSGEGGHVTLAAADDRETGVIEKIRENFGHCSAERLISGPGLSLLHSALHGGVELDAAAIADLAANGDPAAETSLEIFFCMLGTVAANLALTVGALGGIYIGGGIIPRHAGRFAASGFRKRFQAKGRYAGYLESIPTYLIVAAQPALLGLAAYAEDRFISNR
jgi:glucokinase